MNSSISGMYDLSAEQFRLASQLIGGENLAHSQRSAPDQAASPAKSQGPAASDRRSHAGPAPLSFGQRRLFFLQQLSPESAHYNLHYQYRLEGELSVEALQEALAGVVNRHDALRARFLSGENGPIQVIAPVGPIDLPVSYLDALEPEQQLATVAAIRKTQASTPFDLTAGPPCRFKLLRLGPQLHLLACTIHHIVTDGWSMNIFADDLLTLYRQQISREPAAEMPPLPCQYQDFAARQQSESSDDVLDAQLDYWTGRLEGAPASLQIPTSRPRPAIQQFDGAGHDFTIPLELTKRLKSVGRADQATLFMVLLGLVDVLLARYSGQEDIVVGTPVAGRDDADTHSLIGFFVNTVALRTDVSGNPNFRELLQRVRSHVLDDFEHASAPFERIVDRIQSERDLSRSPIFQSMVTLQSAVRREWNLSTGLRMTRENFEPAFSILDLVFSFEESDELECSIVYNTSLFDREFIEGMARHFVRLAESVVADPLTPIDSLTMLTESEESLILRHWNETRDAHTDTRCIHTQFEIQAARTPEAVAVVHEDRSLTYRELDEQSDRLASYLREQGAGPESAIGICLQRTEMLAVAVLGVLKAGAAYVPLDPAYPVERLQHMLRDSGARMVLTSRLAPTELRCEQTLNLEDEWDRIAATPINQTMHRSRPRDAAYIIYTSGSTGTPKGVVVEHSAASAFIHWARQTFSPAQLRRTLACSSLCFDLSVFELFAPLTVGGTVVIVENALDVLRPQSPARSVTLINTVPSAAAALARDLPPSVETVNVAGEPLQRDLVQQLYAVNTLKAVYNLYGPTETTTYSTWTMVGSDDERSPSIGRPIANTCVYVVDRNFAPVPIGVPGELYIGGAGLSRGYRNRPDATALRYVPDPFSPVPGARLYRTGDLARWRADGSLEFLGRADYQVKVRGFRIELGEIEAALSALPEIDQAVVIARDAPGGKQLSGYWTVKPGCDSPGVSAVRDRLRKSLPEYMIPSCFVELDRFPLTPNGKIRRDALPLPQIEDVSAASVAPTTESERAVCRIFADLLGRDSLSIHDDFFELGGHSLLAMQALFRLEHAIGGKLPLQTIFQARTPYTLGERIDALRSAGELIATSVSAITPRKASTAPLSFSQQRMLFLQQMDPDSALYHIPLRIEIRGALDSVALDRALSELERRHEVLRTVFQISCAEPVQRVLESPARTLKTIDLSAVSPGERDAEAARLTKEEANAPFDLLQEPPWRTTLICVNENEHLLLLTFHHIACDGWSFEVIGRELQSLYQAYAAGQSSPLPELAVQYADFAAWQQEWLTDDKIEQQLDYWRTKLQDAPSTLDLPLARQRPAVRSDRGASLTFEITEPVLARLESLGRSENATLFMTLLAAYHVFLYKYSGQADLVIGTPIAGRNRPETAPLIGFFVNTLAMRNSLAGDPSFRSVVARVRTTALEAYAHQDLPFERIVEELQPDRDTSQSAIVQVIFTLQAADRLEWQLDGLQVSTGFARNDTAKFDLSLGITTRTGGATATFNYSTDLFDEAAAERMARHFQQVLESVASEPDLGIETVSLSTPAETATAVDTWNRTATPYPRDLSIQELFERQVALSPDAIAIQDGPIRLSYGELDLRSNEIAHWLRSLGVGRETMVGVCLERSSWTVIAILGILKAGGAYLPLDPDHPAERKRLMLDDAGAQLILSRRGLVASLDELHRRILCVDDPIDCEGWAPTPPVRVNEPEDLAYVMYTSGSTGKPKGIQVLHRGVVRLVCDTDYVQLGAGGRMGMVSNPAFDASTFEIWGALLNGGCLVVIPAETALSPREFAAFLQEQRIDSMFLTSAVFNQTAREAPDAFAFMTNLLVGGDVVDGNSVRQMFASGRPRRLVNGYGPTENTTFSCCYEAVTIGPDDRTIPIGPPIANSTAYVLDAQMRTVPPGITGELYVGGDGLARGYLNRPDLTAERFIPNPFASGQRLYRTGDLARYRFDGAIEFLGRIDHQVKIRGFRIEPEETQAVCAAHPAVRDVAVVVREDEPGNPQLVAYIVLTRAGEISFADLRTFLARQLPGYMIPGAFVEMSSLPLNSNGKLDRKALPAPKRVQQSASFVAPRNATEESIAAIVADVLHLDSVGVHDDFFELGGHSLTAMQVVSRLRALFNRELPLRAFFSSPSVAGLSARMQDSIEEPEFAHVARRKTDGTAPLASYAQQRLLFLQQFDTGSGQYNVPLALRLKGSLSVPALTRALEEIARRHEVLRTHFELHEGQTVQIVAEPQPLDIPLMDLSTLAETDRDLRLPELISQEASRPFDLTSGPVWRQLLVRLSEEDHCLVITTHHIAIDGWSLSVLGRELAALYEAYSTDASSPLPELAVQYADYAVWQHAFMQGDRMASQLAYWRQQLRDAPVALELPTSRPRPPVRSDRGASHTFSIPAEVTAKLKTLCREEKSTLYMGLLAAYQLLLSRHSGQTDLLIGTPVAGRGRSEIEQSIGFFVNTLVLRGDLSGDPTFRELLARCKTTALDAYANQDVPVEKLVEELAPPRDLSRPPLFQTLLVLQNTPPLEWQLPGLQVSVESVSTQTAKFDLTLTLRAMDDGLQAVLVYGTDLFDQGYIEQMAGHFLQLLSSAIEQPDRPSTELPMITDAEWESLTRQQASTASSPHCLHELFTLQAERTPGATAVVQAGRSITYRELDWKSNYFARELRRKGIGPESVVAIHSGRTLGMMIALIGALKAGAAYAPLDPSQPPERLRMMAEDAGAAMTITPQDLAALERAPLDGLTYEPSSGLTPTHMAYVIFTSGSTGRPKGVAVEHRQIVQYVLSISSTAKFSSGDSFALVQPLHVDASATFLFGSLCNGGCLHLLDEEQSAVADLLADYMQRHHIDYLKAAPSHVAALWESSAKPQSLLPRKALFVGGEPARLDLLSRIHDSRPHLAIFNQYGPTETTVGVTLWQFPQAGIDQFRSTAPLGEPLPCARIYILDRSGIPVPAGVKGELCVGGPSVTRGYFGNPYVTAERYQPDPFSSEPGSRMYRTGDMACRQLDGQILFLGRQDDQVKIRGFRVELGEIESALALLPGVREAAAAISSETGALTAYLSWHTPAQADFVAVRDSLRTILPDYMIPVEWCTVDALPRTRHGKVDRRLLAQSYNGTTLDSPAIPIEPRNALENLVSLVWADVLRKERLGVEDDFFDMGGHSLLAMQITSRIRQLFEVDAPLRLVFEAPTVARFAAAMPGYERTPGRTWKLAIAFEQMRAEKAAGAAR